MATMCVEFQFQRNHEVSGFLLAIIFEKIIPPLFNLIKHTHTYIYKWWCLKIVVPRGTPCPFFEMCKTYTKLWDTPILKCLMIFWVQHWAARFACCSSWPTTCSNGSTFYAICARACNSCYGICTKTTASSCFEPSKTNASSSQWCFEPSNAKGSKSLVERFFQCFHVFYMFNVFPCLNPNLFKGAGKHANGSTLNLYLGHSGCESTSTSSSACTCSPIWFAKHQT